MAIRTCFRHFYRLQFSPVHVPYRLNPELRRFPSFHDRSTAPTWPHSDGLSYQQVKPLVAQMLKVKHVNKSSSVEQPLIMIAVTREFDFILAKLSRHIGHWTQQQTSDNIFFQTGTRE